MSVQTLEYLVKFIKTIMLAVLLALIGIIIYQGILLSNSSVNLSNLKNEKLINDNIIANYQEEYNKLSDSTLYKQYLDEYARYHLNLAKNDEVVIKYK